MQLSGPGARRPRNVDADRLAAVRSGQRAMSRPRTRQERWFRGTVDHHSTVDCKAGLLSQGGRRPDSDTNHHHISLDALAIVQDYHVVRNHGCGSLQVENDTVLLMHGADERAELGAEDPFHGNWLRTHHLDVEAAGAERGGHFESDEARSMMTRCENLAWR